MKNEIIFLFVAGISQPTDMLGTTEITNAILIEKNDKNNPIYDFMNKKFYLDKGSNDGK